MKPIKFWIRLSLCLIFIVLNITNSYAASDPTPESFRSIFLSHGEQNPNEDSHVSPTKRLEDDLGEVCFKSLYQFFNKGRQFLPKHLPSTANFMKTHSSALKDYFQKMPKSRINSYRQWAGAPFNNIFYHYFNKPNIAGVKETEIKNMYDTLISAGFDLESNAENMSQAQSTFSKFLWESRTNKKSFGTSINYNGTGNAGAIYAASGPFTSKAYGESLLSIEFNPNATVLDLATPGQLPMLKRAIHSDNSDYLAPIKRCEVNHILLIILEGMGVDLIEYDQNFDWFQVISSKNVSAILSQNQPNIRFEGIQNIFENAEREGELTLTFDENASTEFREFKNFKCVQ